MGGSEQMPQVLPSLHCRDEIQVQMMTSQEDAYPLDDIEDSMDPSLLLFI